MPVDIQVADGAIQGFSQDAKDQLKQDVGEFASRLIAEANRLETGINAGGNPEVTRAMVVSASLLLGRGLTPSRKTYGSKILKILAAIFTTVSGLMYNPVWLRDPAYMAQFVVVVIISIIVLTISIIKD